MTNEQIIDAVRECRYLLIIFLIMNYFLSDLILKRREMRKVIAMLKGFTGKTREDSEWSSVAIMKSLSLKSIDAFSWEIRSYLQQRFSVWSVSEIGEYIIKIEDSGMSKERIDYLKRWIKEAINNLGAKRMAELVIKITADNLSNNDGSQNVYLITARNYITDAVIERHDYDDFIRALDEKANNRNNNYPDNARVVLNSTIITLNHLALTRKIGSNR